MNTAVIVAAGHGKRFGSEKPKQFLEIFGKPIVIHALERFENCSAVDETILVLPAEEIQGFSQIVRKFNLKKLVKIISGGDTRAESVFNGFKEINSEKCKIVTVHDGARPVVSNEEIAQTIESAKKNGAACLVAKVTDTIKEIENGKIVRTVDREKLRRALTPQCFRYDILQRAFAGIDLSSAITDECSLVEKLGIDISVVEGSVKNIKITHAEDLILAENLLKQFNI